MSATLRARTRARPSQAEPTFCKIRQDVSPALAVTYTPISAVVPAPRNVRTHSPKQLQQIAASIGQFGFINPILTDAQGRVVAGHGRLAAAKILGLTEVPTLCLSHMTEAEVRAYRLADNRLAELSGWDEELLALELGELASIDLGFDIDLIGWETAELDQIICLPTGAECMADDEAPDPELEPVCRPGELWHLGNHRLLCGDARSRSNFDTLLNGQLAQMIFTDPPYNVAIEGHVSGLGRRTHREFAMASGEMSQAQFTAFLSIPFTNLAAGSEDGSIHFVCMDWRHLQEMLTAGQAYAELKNLCVWNKDNGGMGAFYRSKHELVFVFKHGSARHINNFGLGEKGRYRTNVWDYAGVNTFRKGRQEDLAAHPTVKPVALVMDAIKDCSKRDGIVLDAFGGSGTTLIAAERTGRRAYMLEIDPLYVDVTVKRWQTLTHKVARLAGTELTFDEAARLRLETPVDKEACHERAA